MKIILNESDFKEKLLVKDIKYHLWNQKLHNSLSYFSMAHASQIIFESSRGNYYLKNVFGPLGKIKE